MSLGEVMYIILVLLVAWWLWDHFNLEDVVVDWFKEKGRRGPPGGAA